MSTKIIKSAAVRVRAADTDIGTIEGYASTFGNVDSYGDTIAPGAFSKTLAAHESEGRSIPVLFGHDGNSLAGHVGHVEKAEEDATGLLVTIKLDDGDDQADKALRLVKSGRIGAMSIGFYATDAEPNPNGDGYRLKEIDLLEVSLVLAPADRYARITSVKAAMPGEAEAVTKDDTAALAKALHDGGLDGLRAMLDQRNPDPDPETSYLDALIEGQFKAKDPRFPSPVNAAGSKLSEERRVAMENAATAHIVKAAADSGRGLTESENDRLRTIQRLEKTRANRREANAVVEQLKSLKNIKGDTGNTDRKDHDTMTTKNAPVTAKQRREVGTRAANTIQEKALNPEGGSVTVESGSTEIVPEPTGRNTLLEIVPQKLREQPNYFFLRQSTRELNADIVPAGEQKPESQLGFEKVAAELSVVAHVTSGIDEYLLRDVSELQTFLSSEMLRGILDRVEQWLIESMANADGHRVQEFAGDMFATARLALAQLDADGFDASAIVLATDDWARMESAKASGSGELVFRTAPVDTSAGTLWGVPVATSAKIPTGTAYALAEGALELSHDGNARFAWNSSGEEFARNEVTFRGEGRFHPDVRRAAGIVEFALEAPAG